MIRLIAIGFLFLPACIIAGEWPQWRGPNRDASWNEKGLLRTFPQDGLKIGWRASLGPGWSSPIVAGHRVYVTDVQLKRPTARERVLCLSETKGNLVWVHDYEVKYPDWAFSPNAGGPRATPIWQNGKVFTLGATEILLCLNASDGELVWKRDLAAVLGSSEFTGITGSPLIEGDLLIQNTCVKPGASVVAFNKETGEEVWRALDDTFSYSSPIVIEVGGQRQLIVWMQEAVTALDPKTGRTLWRELVRTPGDMAVATPVFLKPFLLISGFMLRLDDGAAKPSVIWPQNAAATKRVLSNTSTPLLMNGHVYAARTTGELVCLDAATGKEIWQTNTVTDLKNGAAIHLTQNGDSTLLFTNEGKLIRGRLSSAGYEEISRAHVIDATTPYNGRNVVWPPSDLCEWTYRGQKRPGNYSSFPCP